MSDTYVLYRFWSTDDALLYVGQTINPGRRMEKHCSTTSWWGMVSRISMEPHPTRSCLLDAEKSAIERESPRYNIRMRRGGLRPRAIPSSTEPVIVAASPAIIPAGLKGRFFHSWRPVRPEDRAWIVRGGRAMQWQGLVVDDTGPGHPRFLLVQFFSWLSGEPAGQKLIPISEAVGWTFYSTNVDMLRAAGETEDDMRVGDMLNGITR